MDEVLRSIPHRPPFLFVDEVVARHDEGITTRLKVKPECAFFEGHYPGNPIMPGVILCESVFQSAAIYLAERFVAAQGEEESNVPVLARIQDARFKKSVHPGDCLLVQVIMQDAVKGFYRLKGSITREGDKAMILTLQCALALVGKAKVSHSAVV